MIDSNVKRIPVILLALLLSLGAASAQQTETFGNFINSLPAATILGVGDQLYVRQGGVSKQVPASAIVIHPALGTTGLGISDTSDTSFAAFGTVSFYAATHGNHNAIVGYALNDLPASTVSLPTGVSGYGKVTTNGNTVFGTYGLAELFASGGGVGVANEFTCRNFSGNPPSTFLPPFEGIGTTQTVCNALQITAGGTNNSTIGIYVANEGGSSQVFNTGIYLGQRSFAQYGLFIEPQITGGTPNVTSAVIQNNGTGINLQLGTTGGMTAANAVIGVVDMSSVTHFKVAQNGDVTSTGTITATSIPTSAGSGGLYICVDTSGVFYKKSSCP